MEDTKKGKRTNDNINLQAGILIDLPLADEQAAEISGGPDYRHSDLYLNIGINS
jgi:hypothetical protein